MSCVYGLSLLSKLHVSFLHCPLDWKQVSPTGTKSGVCVERRRKKKWARKRVSVWDWMRKSVKFSSCHIRPSFPSFPLVYERRKGSSRPIFGTDEKRRSRTMDDTARVSTQFPLDSLQLSHSIWRLVLKFGPSMIHGQLRKKSGRRIKENTPGVIGQWEATVSTLGPKCWRILPGWSVNTGSNPLSYFSIFSSFILITLYWETCVCVYVCVLFTQ